MTTSSIATAIGTGVAKGATFGLTEPYGPELRHEATARKYLDETDRRNFNITSGYLVVQPQYEFFYKCPD